MDGWMVWSSSKDCYRTPKITDFSLTAVFLNFKLINGTFRVFDDMKLSNICHQSYSKLYSA